MKRPYMIAAACICMILTATIAKAQNDTEWHKFLDKAGENFGARAEKLNKDYSIGEFDQWDYSQEDGKLRFSGKSNKKLSATAQIIGSYSTYSGTWMWSWANETVNDSVKKGVGKVKEFGSEKNFSHLFEPKFKCAEEYSWVLAKAAGEILNAKGAYRGQIQDGWVYFLITDTPRIDK